MIDIADNRKVLTEALAKLNALPPGASGEFHPDELTALRHFIVGQTSEAQSERESSFYRRIEEILRLHAHQTPPGGAEQRKNLLLRAAIDKCLRGEATTLTVVEISVLESTATQLDALVDPSASHIRLRGLVSTAMTAYLALQELRLATAPHTGNCRCVQAEVFFANAGTRARICEFGEIPIETHARVVEHEGDLEIHGNVPHDVALMIREGTVTIHGQCDGSILATGTIHVRGNIAGPWAISLDADIQCERILGGANVLAPVGMVSCAAIERAGRLFAGSNIQVSQDTRGAHLTAPAIHVGGTIRGSHTQAISSLTCGAIEGDAREPATVVFRNVLSSEDYNLPLTDETLNLLRDTIRFRFRDAVGESMLETLRADCCGVQFTRLYVLSGKSGGVDVPGLRGLQSKAAFLATTLTISGMLEQVLLEALELEGDAHAATLKSGCDECQLAVKFLEREVTQLNEELTRDTKFVVLTACKHLANNAKKIIDKTGDRAGLEEAGQILLARIHEWRMLRQATDSALAEVHADLRNVIGGLVLETDPTRLTHTVNTAVNAAGGAGNTGQMRVLKASAERYTIAIAQYTVGAAEVANERKRLEGQVAENPHLFLAGGRNATRLLKADRVGPHVVLSTSPGLPMPAPGGPEVDHGRIIRVDRPLPSGATFTCDGLTLRRA